MDATDENRVFRKVKAAFQIFGIENARTCLHHGRPNRAGPLLGRRQEVRRRRRLEALWRKKAIEAFFQSFDISRQRLASYNLPSERRRALGFRSQGGLFAWCDYV